MINELISIDPKFTLTAIGFVERKTIYQVHNNGKNVINSSRGGQLAIIN